MGHHFGFCDPGWIGVEMFFVLSGFLITTLLCREHAKDGSISLPHSGLGWAFRLLPIYWLYIGVVTLAIVFREPGDWSRHSPWGPGISSHPSGAISSTSHRPACGFGNI